jgi:Raf kinase inhibitor-like YbhB/YbcL family protein
MKLIKKLYIVLMGGLVMSAVATRNSSAFTLESKSFRQDEEIPALHAYTRCGGQNHSPDLEWSNAPKGTKSFALVVHDPDAPNGHFVHWVIFNIPESVTNLAAHVPKDKELDDGALQGTNDFGGIGYDGPCPPSGTHHYVFTLFAVDQALDLPAGASEAELQNRLSNHILATTTLTGRYKAA